jgi:hypothetical protein
MMYRVMVSSNGTVLFIEALNFPSKASMCSEMGAFISFSDVNDCMIELVKVIIFRKYCLIPWSLLHGEKGNFLSLRRRAG